MPDEQSDPIATPIADPKPETGFNAESPLAPAPPPPAPPTPVVSPSSPNVSLPYADRSTGLVIFGVVQIILGLLAALMVPFVALGAFLSRLAPGASMRPGQLISGIATYAFFAVVLLSLGIGSVQYRRWARALTVVISWYWLITGVLITVLLTAVLPVTVRGALQAQQRTQDTPGVPAGVMAAILTIIIVLAAIFLIVVPTSFVVFYGRKDVGETCRRRDPVERWTDRIPLPVLGAGVVLAVQALYLFSTGLSTPLFPFFGRYLTGLVAILCFLGWAAVDGCLAVALLRMSRTAWWVAVVVAPLRLISMAVTYARGDLMQAYSKIGFSDMQIQVMNSSPFFRGHVVLWWSLISAVLFFGYLLWLKRYFRGSDIPQPQVLGVPVG